MVILKHIIRKDICFKKFHNLRALLLSPVVLLILVRQYPKFSPIKPNFGLLLRRYIPFYYVSYDFFVIIHFPSAVVVCFYLMMLSRHRYSHLDLLQRLQFLVPLRILRQSSINCNLGLLQFRLSQEIVF